VWEKVSLDLLFGGGMLTIGDRSTTMLLHRGYDVRDPSVGPGSSWRSMTSTSMVLGEGP
jgi:hypothetical protein